MQQGINLALLQTYNESVFKDIQAPLLSALKNSWQRSKPLAGVRILHNIPLTHETLVKVESLVAAGADLTLSQVAFIPSPPEEKILAILQQAGIKVVLSHQDLAGEFDIALDCCAEILAMDKVKIQRGIVELTQTGGERYKSMKLALPVINVDDSHLKKLEGMYGTGEAFLRAVKEQTQSDLSNQHFVIFGYGKVGKGIVRYLLKETPFITVVDASAAQLAQAQAQGLSVAAIHEKDKIRDAVKKSFCIVTATGKPAALSELVTQADCQKSYIANMGTHDEIGDKIHSQKILCNRVAINFSLKHPTLLNYIDPVFYAHNLAAELLLTNRYNAGYHPFPPYLDALIVDLWKAHNPIDISDIYD